MNPSEIKIPFYYFCHHNLIILNIRRKAKLEIFKLLHDEDLNYTTCKGILKPA